VTITGPLPQVSATVSGGGLAAASAPMVAKPLETVPLPPPVKGSASGTGTSWTPGGPRGRTYWSSSRAPRGRHVGWARALLPAPGQR